MKSKRSRAIIKSMHKELRGLIYKAGFKDQDRNVYGVKKENKAKFDRLMYKIKYQNQLLKAKKRGF